MNCYTCHRRSSFECKRSCQLSSSFPSSLMQRKNVTVSSGPLKLHFHHLCLCSLLLLSPSLFSFSLYPISLIYVGHKRKKQRESVREKKRKQRSNIIINHDREENTFLKQDKKGIERHTMKECDRVNEKRRRDHFQSLPIVPLSFHPFPPSKSLVLSLSHLSLHLNFNVSIKWSWNESRNVCSTWMLLGLPIQSSILYSRLSFSRVLSYSLLSTLLSYSLLFFLLSYPFSFPNHHITTTCTSSFCLILFVSLPLPFPLTNSQRKHSSLTVIKSHK